MSIGQEESTQVVINFTQGIDPGGYFTLKEVEKPQHCLP